MPGVSTIDRTMLKKSYVLWEVSNSGEKHKIRKNNFLTKLRLPDLSYPRPQLQMEPALQKTGTAPLALWS